MFLEKHILHYQVSGTTCGLAVRAHVLGHLWYTLEAKPFNINVMQVYAPTQDHDDEEIEQFYQEIQNGIKYTVR